MSVRPSAPKRVSTLLVVDDDERLLAAYTRATPGDARLLTATDAKSAMRIVGEKTPDLVIVDMRLGVTSGIDLVRSLKTARPQMVVVMCSAYMSVQTTVEAIRAGADEVIPKPVTLKEVLRRVEGEPPSETEPETPTLRQAEWEHIMRVLGDCQGNISEAARRLGIYRSTLKRRLRRLTPD